MTFSGHLYGCENIERHKRIHQKQNTHMFCLVAKDPIYNKMQSMLNHKCHDPVLDLIWDFLEQANLEMEYESHNREPGPGRCVSMHDASLCLWKNLPDEGFLQIWDTLRSVLRELIKGGEEEWELPGNIWACHLEQDSEYNTVAMEQFGSFTNNPFGAKLHHTITFDAPVYSVEGWANQSKFNITRQPCDSCLTENPERQHPETNSQATLAVIQVDESISIPHHSEKTRKVMLALAQDALTRKPDSVEKTCDTLRDLIVQHYPNDQSLHDSFEVFAERWIEIDQSQIRDQDGNVYTNYYALPRYEFQSIELPEEQRKGTLNQCLDEFVDSELGGDFESNLRDAFLSMAIEESGKDKRKPNGPLFIMTDGEKDPEKILRLSTDHIQGLTQEIIDRSTFSHWEVSPSLPDKVEKQPQETESNQPRSGEDLLAKLGSNYYEDFNLWDE